MAKNQVSWPVPDGLLASAIQEAKTILENDPNAALEYDNTAFDSTAVDMYWSFPEQLKTFLKNNVGRSSKRTALLRDSSYKGPDARKKKRAIYCLKVLDLALAINPNSFPLPLKLQEGFKQNSSPKTPTTVVSNEGKPTSTISVRPRPLSDKKGLATTKRTAHYDKSVTVNGNGDKFKSVDVRGGCYEDDDADDDIDVYHTDKSHVAYGKVNYYNASDEEGDIHEYNHEGNATFRTLSSQFSPDNRVYFHRAISSLVAMQGGGGGDEGRGDSDEGKSNTNTTSTTTPDIHSSDNQRVSNIPPSPRKQQFFPRFSAAFVASNNTNFQLSSISTAHDPLDTPSLAQTSPMSTSSLFSASSYDSYRSKSPFATTGNYRNRDGSIVDCMSPTPPPAGSQQNYSHPFFVIPPLHMCHGKGRLVGGKSSNILELSQEEIDVAFILEGLSASAPTTASSSTSSLPLFPFASSSQSKRCASTSAVSDTSSLSESTEEDFIPDSRPNKKMRTAHIL